MYIEPSTNIKILKNCPLDKTYDHTLYFESKQAQATYFMSLTKYNLTSYTYQRVGIGKARVGISADNIYDCNYMMFQNTNYGNKWFYAFIESIEYVNNETSTITFSIDDIQTWYFDYELDDCFIERQHTATDIIGQNLTPEPVALGEYVMNGYQPITDMTSMVVCIAIVDVDQIIDGQLYDGIYGSAELWVYDSTDVDTINGKLKTYAQNYDSIIGMYMFPKKFIGEIPDTHRLTFGASAMKTTIRLSGTDGRDKLDGYTPKNHKLYTYPYNFLHVDNASGSELALRYEFFESVPVVEISGTVTQPVTACLRPCSYKGVPGYDELGGYTTLNTESLQLTNYPLCSWNIDAYQAWVAQNSIPLLLNTGADIGKLGIASAFSSNPGLTLGSGAIGEVTSLLSQTYQASIASDISKGSLSNGGVNVSNHKQQFYYGRCSVNKQFARNIDDFFSMYGYAINHIAKPNTHARPHWTYIKTGGCVVTGSMPADSERHICEIFDKGITFWRNGSEVGNYSLDNSPT